MVLPGTLLVGAYFDVANPGLLVSVVTLAAFGFLLLAISAGFAHDAEQLIGAPEAPATMPPARIAQPVGSGRR